MASGAVWGIDIGQCALKALRCHAHDEPDKIVADAFDYIEYPKILSQPGSDPAELISEALKQFLSRNSVLGDRVAVSVSGQAGLARFIKLPPVEAKKIPDIVRYEAKQQIPFDLNDVIWDYQRMGGGGDEEGFALETEIGLFAMKREAVFRALEPFVKVDIEVDIVQLTPEVLYNFLVFDQLGALPSPEEYDPENPPESIVVISLGTDATDLVISNGFRVWQRSVPLGGNHFSKALTKELKLAFAKAEHMKRNATAAADPKAVFQAMRPVFSDLLTELQRSIGYFSNLDRAAKIGRVIALGNAMKLPGLRRYLSQSLGFEIEKLDAFRGLVGAQVVSAPAFQENLLSFPVAYGLALQGLGKGQVHTNLLPREIINDRLIKRKKPWAVAAAAVLMLGCSVSFAAYSLGLGTVNVDRWKTAEEEASRLSAEARRFQGEADAAAAEFEATNQVGQNLVSNVEGRTGWLELLKAINACIPSDPPRKPDAPAPPIPDRNELHVTNLDCQRAEDVSQWYALVRQWDDSSPNAANNAAGDPAANGAMDAVAPTSGEPAPMGGPMGPGWIVQISGYHYHNGVRFNQGAQYVRKTLLKKLRTATVQLPTGEPGVTEEVTMRDLGISYPVLVGKPKQLEAVKVTDPSAKAAAAPSARGRFGTGGPGSRRTAGPAAGNNGAAPGTIHLQKFDFVVHFCWQPKTPTQRQQEKEKKAKQQKEQAAYNTLGHPGAN
jgi:type IV pilus assembly protein PilM